MARSRGAVGTSADDAAAESFHASLKRNPSAAEELVRGAIDPPCGLPVGHPLQHLEETLQHRSDQPDRLRAKIQYVLPDE